MAAELAVFGGFAIATQVVLLAYFALRRLRPELADRYGWLAYGFGLFGLPISLWLLATGSPWEAFSGPILFAAWAGFGGWADTPARGEWRQPIRWTVFGPYVLLYVAAQMFMWWPLWDRSFVVWLVYLELFAANTVLNLAGHVGTRPRSRIRHA